MTKDEIIEIACEVSDFKDIYNRYFGSVGKDEVRHDQRGRRKCRNDNKKNKNIDRNGSHRTWGKCKVSKEIITKTSMGKIITLSEFAQISGVAEEVLKSKRGQQHATIARQMYWLYLTSTGRSCYSIAKQFGRTPDTVSAGVKSVKGLIETRCHLIYPYQEFIKSFVR